MRILVLIHEFPPLGGGGGQAAQDIGEGLSERGHEVKVLTAHMRGLPRSTHRRGVDVIRVPSLRREAYRAGFLTMAAYIAAGLWEGYRLIRRWRPDVLHAHFAVPAGALAWMLSKLSGVPYVLTAHLGDVPGGVPEKTDRWFKWILPFTFPIWRDAKKVTAVSEYTRQLALQHYRREIMVIPNGIDLERLRAKEIRLHTPRRIVFAGRFMPQKNPRQVVEVLARIKDLPWECVMLGDGPLMPQVREAIARHGLEGRFILPGWVTPEEVLQWFDRSDILFMPSLSEGLPVVGVQALAKGLAIVASRVGGFVDLVRDGENGFLVKPEQPEKFFKTLRKLIPNSSLLSAFRRKSQEMATRFAIKEVVLAYESLFLSL